MAMDQPSGEAGQACGGVSEESAATDEPHLLFGRACHALDEGSDNEARETFEEFVASLNRRKLLPGIYIGNPEHRKDCAQAVLEHLWRIAKAQTNQAIFAASSAKAMRIRIRQAARDHVKKKGNREEASPNEDHSLDTKAAMWGRPEDALLGHRLLAKLPALLAPVAALAWAGLPVQSSDPERDTICRRLSLGKTEVHKRLREIRTITQEV